MGFGEEDHRDKPPNYVDFYSCHLIITKWLLLRLQNQNNIQGWKEAEERRAMSVLFL